MYVNIYMYVCMYVCIFFYFYIYMYSYVVLYCNVFIQQMVRNPKLQLLSMHWEFSQPWLLCFSFAMIYLDLIWSNPNVSNVWYGISTINDVQKYRKIVWWTKDNLLVKSERLFWSEVVLPVTKNEMGTSFSLGVQFTRK